MQTKKQLSRLSVLAIAAITFIFAGCENQGAFAPDLDTQDDGLFTASDAVTEMVLDEGPLSQKQLNAIKAPVKRIQVAEQDLKVLKSISPARLQKHLVAHWNVPLGASGWAYTGDDLHGKSWLYFPLDALNQATTIKMDSESTGILEFSPHGIQFNKPVTAWISYKDADLSGISEKDLKLWYFNEDTGMWELIGDVVDTENKMVGGLLNHFSKYSVGHGE